MKSQDIPPTKQSSDNDRKAEIDLDIVRTGVALSASETVNRYGSANAEYIKGYTGIDNQTGQKFAKGLAGIAKGKVHSDYKEANIKQQAGYSAEVATTSRDNAEAIIAQSKVRIARSDDLPQYGKNHRIVDRVQIQDGTIIEGSETQMKFVENRNDLFSKIAGERKGKSDLSRYLDVDIELPSEQFEGAAIFCKNRADRLRRQANLVEQGRPKKAAQLRLQARNIEQTNPESAAKLLRRADIAEHGNPDEAAKFRRKANNYDKLASKVRDSGMTTKEAIYYREHPKTATALDIARTGHRAGIEGAKYGATIGGCISLLQNTFAAAQGKKDIGEAIKDTAINTAQAGAIGYGTAFVGAGIKGAMQQSSRQALRTLANTNAPALAVNVCLSLGSSVKRYVSGDISEAQLLTEVGEKGAGMLSSSMMAALGQLAIPIPVVGAVVGGMIGYTLSSMFYQSALDAARGVEASRELLERTQAIESAARARIAEEQAALDDFFRREIPELRQETQNLFAAMNATGAGQTDALAAAINQYATLLGRGLEFQSLAEFTIFLQSDQPLRL